MIALEDGRRVVKLLKDLNYNQITALNGDILAQKEQDISVLLPRLLIGRIIWCKRLLRDFLNMILPSRYAIIFVICILSLENIIIALVFQKFSLYL